MFNTKDWGVGCIRPAPMQLLNASALMLPPIRILMCILQLCRYFKKMTCPCSWLWLSSSSVMRAVLSVSMVCCCWKESCSCMFCSLELWQTRLAPCSFSCSEDTCRVGKKGDSIQTIRDGGAYKWSCRLWVLLKTLPCHEFSAAHSHSSSLPHPSAADTYSAPLYRLTETTVAHMPDAQTKVIDASSCGGSINSRMLLQLNLDTYLSLNLVTSSLHQPW